MGETALIAVDVQRDFLPEGTLGVSEGHKVIRPLIRISRFTDYVVLTRDWHPVDHISFRPEGIWPEHCVQGTEGAEIDPEILVLADCVISKGYDPHKEAYSGFEGKDLGSGYTLMQILERKRIDEVIIGGLATDYCVKATALDARKNGLKTKVAANAIRGVDYISSVMAIAEMCEAGAELTVLGGLAS